MAWSYLYGLLVIAGYGIPVAWIVMRLAESGAFTKERFLVAGRNVPWLRVSVSVAAAWIWAPALFVSAQKAYTQGWAGLFWFTVPNVLCLVLFAFFAERIRTLFPDGYTLSGYMRSRFSKRAQGLYVLELGGLAICSFAVQLVAGGKVIATMTDLPYPLVIVLMTAIPVVYTMKAGIRASITSDFIQMGIIFFGLAIAVPWVIWNAGGMSTVVRGLYGNSGTYSSLFSGDGLTVFFTFGLPVTIGLLSGPFGDQSFYARAYATERDKVRRTFLVSAAIFAVVPLTMSLLGFVAAGTGIHIENAQQVNIETVAAYLPKWMMVPFLYLLLSGLVSKLDTNLSAISSLTGHDALGGRDVGDDVKHYSRGGMVLLAVGGIVIAYVIGTYVENPVLYLFLVYGTLRSSVLLPTMMTLLMKRVSESGVFWGILVSLTIGLPIFAYGNLTHQTMFIVGGSLFTVLASGTITWTATASRK